MYNRRNDRSRHREWDDRGDPRSYERRPEWSDEDRGFDRTTDYRATDDRATRDMRPDEYSLGGDQYPDTGYRYYDGRQYARGGYDLNSYRRRPSRAERDLRYQYGGDSDHYADTQGGGFGSEAFDAQRYDRSRGISDGDRYRDQRDPYQYGRPDSQGDRRGYAASDRRPPRSYEPDAREWERHRRPYGYRGYDESESYDGWRSPDDRRFSRSGRYDRGRGYEERRWYGDYQPHDAQFPAHDGQYDRWRGDVRGGERYLGDRDGEYRSKGRRGYDERTGSDEDQYGTRGGFVSQPAPGESEFAQNDYGLGGGIYGGHSDRYEGRHVGYGGEMTGPGGYSYGQSFGANPYGGYGDSKEAYPLNSEQRRLGRQNYSDTEYSGTNYSSGDQLPPDGSRWHPNQTGGADRYDQRYGEDGVSDLPYGSDSSGGQPYDYRGVDRVDYERPESDSRRSALPGPGYDPNYGLDEQPIAPDTEARMNLGSDAMAGLGRGIGSDVASSGPHALAKGSSAVGTGSVVASGGRTATGTDSGAAPSVSPTARRTRTSSGSASAGQTASGMTSKGAASNSERSSSTAKRSISTSKSGSKAKSTAKSKSGSDNSAATGSTRSKSSRRGSSKRGASQDTSDASESV